jgi:hypothetical protein
MTDLPKFSLGQQIEAVRFAETRQRSLIGRNRSVKELRPESVAQMDMQRLGAAARTLETLQENADEIRAFLKLPAEARQAVLQHGATLAKMCMQVVKAEAAAKAGGPVR